MLCLALLTLSAAARGAIVEETLSVPVRLALPDDRELSQEIAVTIVRTPSAGRRPFLVLLHGRAAAARGRAAMGLQTYPANSRYFAGLGFVVLIPTRVGYGVSGGPDVEFTGGCRFKQYDRGLAAAVSQVRQLLQYADDLPYVDGSRGIVVGESFGGLAAVAVAASGIDGVTGAVNVSGGDGGDARRRPDRPCRPDQLRDAFAHLGKWNRLPTLWLYSANDRVWGPRYPLQWFAAFVQAGGRGEFVGLPPDKNNGHFIFNRNAPAWRPAFERFRRELGFGDPQP